MPGTAEAQNPFISPDGEWVRLHLGGELEKPAVAGGDPVKLTEVVTDNPGGAGARNGFLYFTPSWNSGLWRISRKVARPNA